MQVNSSSLYFKNESNTVHKRQRSVQNVRDPKQHEQSSNLKGTANAPLRDLRDKYVSECRYPAPRLMQEYGSQNDECNASISEFQNDLQLNYRNCVAFSDEEIAQEQEYSDFDLQSNGNVVMLKSYNTTNHKEPVQKQMALTTVLPRSMCQMNGSKFKQIAKPAPLEIEDNNFDKNYFSQQLKPSKFGPKPLNLKTRSHQKHAEASSNIDDINLWIPQIDATLEGPKDRLPEEMCVIQPKQLTFSQVIKPEDDIDLHEGRWESHQSVIFTSVFHTAESYQ